MKEGSYYIIAYTFFWIITYLYHRRSNKYFGSSSFLLILNIIFGISSLMLYNDPILGYYKVTFWPFVYLYVAELIILLPLLRYRDYEIDQIEEVNIKLVKTYSYIYVISAILRFPTIFSHISTGVAILVSGIDGGNELYNASHDMTYASVGFFESTAAIIYNVFTDLGVLMFFYLLSIKDRDPILRYGYILAFIASLLLPISMGLRTGVIMQSLTIIIAFICMRQFLPEETSRKFIRYGSIAGGFILVLFMMLSISRFSWREGGTFTYFLSYAGQAPLNFNENVLDAGGIRYGDRTANTFKQLLGYSNVPTTITGVRDKYPSLSIDDSLFTTFVGDFVLDYGPIVTMVIFIVFSLIIISITKNRGPSIPFHKIIALYFVMCILVQGGFYLFNYSFKNNYTIIAFVLTYFLFKGKSNLNFYG